MHLDAPVDVARTHSDVLATRCLTLHVTPDGRVARVADGTHLDAFRRGGLPTTT